MFPRLQTTKVPSPSSTRARRHCFTLVELLAAVALVAVLGVFLIRFYTNMQRAYNESLRMASMSEDSRAVFALLTRDLRLSATRENDLPGYDIKIHQPAVDQLWFVTSNESGSGVGDSLLEVSYRLNGTMLQRAEVSDVMEDTTGALVPNPDWNPYGDRDDASQQEGYQDVLERVIGFRITCYTDRLFAYMPEQSTQAPSMVTVILTILDRKSFARWQLLPEPQRTIYGARQSRTFRQTIQIPATQFVVN